ncbi:MAG: hypothetical protein JW881_19205, partial [Spirochaetales bacterium]|nr:hypothetical protein [Spirochaetales bacterium]
MLACQYERHSNPNGHSTSSISAYIQQFPVFYKGKNIGIFYADLVIEKKIIVELKA